MVIAMSQITQVAQSTLASVCREFSAFFAHHPATNQSEHWQVALSEHSRTEQRVRRTAVVIASLCAALVGASCNVYDSSLLGVDPGSDGGRAGGPLFPGGGAATSGGGTVGNAGNNWDDAGAAASLGGADAGGGQNTVAGSGGVAGGSAGSGMGGGAELGGGPAGGAGSLTLSVIDDMEMPDPNIPNTDMRAGFWSLSNDGKGTQTPPTMVMSTIPMARGTSLHALHTATTGFKSDSVIGVDLNRKAVRATYDASAYKAVHFFAKVEAASATAVHFAILDKHTDPGGMLCCPTQATCTGTEDYMANGLCYDHFAKDLTFTTAWAEYTIPFSDLNQIGWGLNNVDALDAAHVFNIQFSWGPDPMNLWIDDISFVKK